jgi:heterodisulfide reductase subunit C2
MTIRVGKTSANNSLLGRVQEVAGVDLSLCYQCRKCSSGCPVSELVTATPSEIIRRLQLGAGEELLESDLVWLCLSCETCFTRCPMRINTAAVVDALRILAVAKGMPAPKGNPPLFNRLFLSTVKSFGRAYDLPALAAYKLRTGNMADDVKKLPAMLRKGKMAVLPPSGADRKTVQRIFDRMERGAKK